jgi:hypothetical protein
MRRKLRALTGAGKILLKRGTLDVDYRIIVWGDMQSRSAEGTLAGLPAETAYDFYSSSTEVTLQLQDGAEVRILPQGVQGELVAILVNTPISF